MSALLLSLSLLSMVATGWRPTATPMESRLSDTPTTAATAITPQHNKRHLVMMDCDPPAQAGWTTLCMQEDADTPVRPGMESNCSAERTNNNQWLQCAGERLVRVHTTWGMPGLLRYKRRPPPYPRALPHAASCCCCLLTTLTMDDDFWLSAQPFSLGDLWDKPCDNPNTCTCPGTPPTMKNCTPYAPALSDDWAMWLSGELDALRPAFMNGSIAGIALGDELCADGVPVSNLSSVASFIKRELQGSGVFIVTNEDTTSFGGDLPRVSPPWPGYYDYPGSFVAHGGVPEAIDYISIDTYTGLACFNLARGGSAACGCEIHHARVLVLYPSCCAATYCCVVPDNSPCCGWLCR